jgi:hypothetical protein
MMQKVIAGFGGPSVGKERKRLTQGLIGLGERLASVL